MKKIYFIHFSEIDSTNKWIKRHSQVLNPKHMTCIVSDAQSAGIGSRGRKWLSPPGNLYFSLYFTIPKESAAVPFFSQFASLVTAKILKSLGFSPNIKWPNDLILSEKKVGGILTEVIPKEPYLGIILGVGVNLNMSVESCSQIDQPATSLSVESGKQWVVNEILHKLLDEFQAQLPLFIEEGFASFEKEYNELLLLQETRIGAHE